MHNTIRPSNVYIYVNKNDNILVSSHSNKLYVHSLSSMEWQCNSLAKVRNRLHFGVDNESFCLVVWLAKLLTNVIEVLESHNKVR